MGVLLKELFLSFLENYEDEEEIRKSDYGFLIDEFGEEFFDEEAFEGYWKGLKEP